MLDAIEQFSASLVQVVFSSVRLGGVDIQLIVLWLAVAMVFFTFRLGFLNVRGFGAAVDILRGRRADPSAPGEISQQAALATALSGTVGLGNIAGVAIAISIGGPGAAFWMFVIGFFAMSLKFAEVTLAVKYRQQTADGRYTGGPMWTLRNAFASRGRPRIGKVLGGIYAGFAILAFIQIIQINQSYAQLNVIMGFGETKWTAFAYGLIVAFAAGMVLIGGVKSIARVTTALVPFMGGLYVIGVLMILALNVREIPGALELIFSEAMNPSSVQGGVLGAFVAGMRRAVYSSEAGIGSSAIAHAIAKTRSPASEGFVALLEPFIDTVVICTATALAIVTSGAWRLGLNDIAMTSAAFETVSVWFPYLLAVAVFLFAFSTIIATGYYALQAWKYLAGSSRTLSRLYMLFFCGSLPLGALMDVSTAVNIIDSLFFLLAAPNIIGLYIFSNEIARDAGAYLQEARRNKAIERNED